LAFSRAFKQLNKYIHHNTGKAQNSFNHNHYHIARHFVSRRLHQEQDRTSEYTPPRHTPSAPSFTQPAPAYARNKCSGHPKMKASGNTALMHGLSAHVILPPPQHDPLRSLLLAISPCICQNSIQRPPKNPCFWQYSPYARPLCRDVRRPQQRETQVHSAKSMMDYMREALKSESSSEEEERKPIGDTPLLNSCPFL
jgi:hypothetical protein